MSVRFLVRLARRFTASKAEDGTLTGCADLLGDVDPSPQRLHRDGLFPMQCLGLPINIAGSAGNRQLIPR
jgi:hypothetical protein